MDADTAVHAILVPGAWMGGWIWEPTVQALRDRGIHAHTLTLSGLEPGESAASRAAVRLADHVAQVVMAVEDLGSRPVVLVSHSYSGMVTATAADRLSERVLGQIHVGAFLARSGRSMLDDWGDSDEARAQERSAIEADDYLWQAPTRPMLDHENDLTPRDRDRLASRFTPHPGRTVLDPAEVSMPVEAQPSTYVALTPQGGFEEAWEDAPPLARAASGWRRRHLVSGHWPMVSAFEATVDLLDAEIRHFASARG